VEIRMRNTNIDWNAYVSLSKSGDYVDPELLGDLRPGELVDPETLRAEIDDFYINGYRKGMPTGWPTLDEHWTIRKGELTVITGIPGHGKALALDTPIPTPDGWTTMGDIQPGDVVFDESGLPCTVIRATEVMHGHECFQLTFSDGTQIVADGDHQWVTWDYRARLSVRNAKAKNRLPYLRQRGTDQTHKRTPPKTRSTKDIHLTLTSEHGKRRNHSIVTAKPIHCREAEFIIPPYVLGAWIGDGHTNSGAITTADEGVLDSIRKCGISTTPRKSFGKGLAATYGIGVAGYGLTKTQASLHAKLRTLGVLGNKHIPSVYLRSSREQRLELLKGLMDTDGYITPYGRCEFTTIIPRLADNVAELVASLGWIPKIITGRAMLRGKDCGAKYRVTFTPDASVFALERKSVRTVTSTPRLGCRRITACDPVPSVPVRCIKVDSQSHLYLCSKAFIPTHNSSWADNLMVNLAATQNWRWAAFSAENLPASRYAAGLMEIHADKPFRQGPHPRMTVAERDQHLEWVIEHFHLIQPSADRFSLDRIIQIASQINDLDGLIIDPWNELDISRPKEMREDEFIGNALTKIRWLARQAQIHVLIVAHPAKYHRIPGQPKPVITLNDVKGASEWYAKADNGLSVWRDEADTTGRSDVHIQKVRFREVGRAGGAVSLYYDRVTGRFR
jgi:replicative DNA helicase